MVDGGWWMVDGGLMLLRRPGAEQLEKSLQSGIQ
jgi:hypothetical protein